MAHSLAILDTNILDYGFKKDFAESVALLIEQLAKEYELVTTQFSRFELFRGLTSARIPAAKALFDSFTCIDINGDVFKIAAALSSCYKNDSATSSRASSYGDGDIIIGAACLVNNAFIITANINDFPRPYFLESSAAYTITSPRTNKTITIGALRPNIPYVNQGISRLYPAAAA